jgi:hypothetical protein
MLTPVVAMNSVMSECNFTSTSYSPEKTSLVDNVQVVATRPALTTSWSNAGVSSDASCGKGPLGLAAAAAVIVISGAVLFL